MRVDGPTIKGREVAVLEMIYTTYLVSSAVGETLSVCFVSLAEMICRGQECYGDLNCLCST